MSRHKEQTPPQRSPTWRVADNCLRRRVEAAPVQFHEKLQIAQQNARSSAEL